MEKLKIGLLPLYIKLYDDSSPEIRPKIDGFLHTIQNEFARRGVDVVKSDACRITSEFRAAIAAFEDAGVDAIVTLHLAYSPSLESAQALADTRLPLVILDTTPDFDFNPAKEPALIDYNHGIHGVQDMCNLLLRNRKPFEIEAGHWSRTDVIDRVVAWVRAAHIANTFRHMRVGRIGGSFAGMGDFAVTAETLHRQFNIEVVEADPKELAACVQAVSEPDIAREAQDDRERFNVQAAEEPLHDSLKTGLAVRRWIHENRLGAFSFNFLKISRASGLPVVPFLEACKELAAGVGYAGEGDVLTASLVGAFLTVFPESTFAEMFCPDWEHDLIFISHMGEMNLRLCEGTPCLTDVPYPYTDAGRPVTATGRYRAGKAVLVNLAPGPDGRYSLIVVPVEMLSIIGEDHMQDVIRGWFRPPKALPEFLPEYSRLGGTHHSALVYGSHSEDIIRFARIMGWTVHEIR